MAIRIFNTLTRRKEPFVPVCPGKVKMYVCGPTAYDDPHPGHARSAVVYDVMRRYLRVKGYAVTLVRNITDIDDKILEKARRERLNYRDISTRYSEAFDRETKRLGVKVPDLQPKASEHIIPIQEFIARLVQNGHAYASGGNVYYAVSSCECYGLLSGCTMPAPVVDENDCREHGKRHPADFALWKAARSGEPFWPSPWGAGRPGWHIECTAMSANLLGPVFDIHGGGEDLIFPHHENEIAQSIGIFGQIPANYWVHNGLVHADGKKMSKSSGNGMKLAELLDTYPADALRLFLLSKKYRHPIHFSIDKMEEALKKANRINRFFSTWGPCPDAPGSKSEGVETVWRRFCSAMDDDFNFPMAISIVFAGIRTLYRRMGSGAAGRHARRLENHRAAICDLYFICRKILGLQLNGACRTDTGCDSGALVRQIAAGF